MLLTETKLKRCFIIEPDVWTDGRGDFRETYNKKNVNKLMGFSGEVVQCNESRSKKHVLRGLHLQTGFFAQSKLVRVTKGSVLDVCVDLREKSPTFGQHIKVKLTENDNKLLFIPKGFAHGFLSLEEDTVLTYQCDVFYNKKYESGVMYNDEDLKIDWGVDESDLIISKKDLELKTLKEWKNDR
tara:strand:- start:7980 stop:8531 length:552 start_codon:yes stop_codon:yes gene_type:complete